jgi:hypothetical protein
MDTAGKYGVVSDGVENERLVVTDGGDYDDCCL